MVVVATGGGKVSTYPLVLDSPLLGRLSLMWCPNLETHCCFVNVPSLKLTASLHLKMDGWNTIVSFWGPGPYSGANCSFQGG